MSTAYTATGSGMSPSLPMASVVNGISTMPNITRQFNPMIRPSTADSDVTCWWLARQNDTTTTKLIEKANSDEPFASFNAARLLQAAGEKSSTVVISSVTANAKIASKKVTAR